MKIHFLTYADGKIRDNTQKSYSDTQRLLLNSIQKFSKYEVVNYEYGMENLIKNEYFPYIKNFPNVSNSHWGYGFGVEKMKRGGYFNVFKPIFIKQIFDNINDGDVIYYTDSSGYFMEPFKFSIDKLVDGAKKEGAIMGSASKTVLNNSFGCCDNINVWEKIWKESSKNINTFLNLPHILNSWFMFEKNEFNKKFVNEWFELSIKEKINDIPLIAMHHTVDQSIFNILVYKYGYKVFYKEDIPHDNNKNHNLVHQILNANEKHKKYFLNPKLITL